MRKRRKTGISGLQIGLAALGVIGLAILLYQLPPVQSRLGWRLDFWWTGVRMALNPAGALPTPMVVSESVMTDEPVFPTNTPPPPTHTPAPTPTNAPSPTPLPESVLLAAPEYELQRPNNCGPATLAMYLRYYGWSGDQFDVADVVKPISADRNVNVEELQFYAANHAGWLNFQFRVGGDIQTLKSLLAAGFPVMIEEGDILTQQYWPDDDMWAGHYLLLNGYNDAAQRFTVQDSFYGADRTVSYAETDERWKAFNRVYILLYPPEREAELQALLGAQWDAAANRQHALEQAQAEIDADPGDAYAWFNLGSNHVYFEQWEAAADAYDEARRLGLPQRMLRYQFGPFFAYFHSHRTDELMVVTEYALRITDNSEESLLWRGWGLYRQGESAEAVGMFQAAYAVNPLSFDAQYALDFMGAIPQPLDTPEN
jgi:tetratricopeptide (TPR) repeat protein